MQSKEILFFKKLFLKVSPRVACLGVISLTRAYGGLVFHALMGEGPYTHAFPPGTLSGDRTDDLYELVLLLIVRFSLLIMCYYLLLCALYYLLLFGGAVGDQWPVHHFNVRWFGSLSRANIGRWRSSRVCRSGGRSRTRSET